MVLGRCLGSSLCVYILYQCHPLLNSGHRETNFSLFHGTNGNFPDENGNRSSILGDVLICLRKKWLENRRTGIGMDVVRGTHSE